MRVAFDVSPAGDKVNAVDVATPSQLHVERVLHVEDDDGAIRVWGVREGVVRLVGKAARREAVIFTRTGDAPWELVAKGMGAALEGAVHEERLDEVVADDFVTFDVDREGVPSNLNHHREKELRTHEEGSVQVVVVEGRVTVYANGEVLGRARKEKNALVPTDEGYLVWGRIRRGIATATPWKPDGAPGWKPDRAPARDSSPRIARPTMPWTPRKQKWVAFVAALYGFLVAGLVVGVVRDGVGPISVLAIELVAIAIAPLVLAWGVWILSSPEALREPTTTQHDGTKQSGPLANKGLALTTVGALIYAYPALVSGFLMFGSRSPTTNPTTSPTTSSPNPPPSAPPKPAATVAKPAREEPASLAAAVSMLGNESDVARYAIAHRLVLDQVKLAAPETSIPLALRDGARERGKRTCATGAIEDIERKDLDSHDVYAGLLTTAEGDGVRFVAVGSSGLLVRRSAATLCGVVIGTAERKVVMVGMFDLPENAQPTVER